MISKTATKQDVCRKKISFFNSARNAWSKILSNLSAEDSILLPSYIGVTDREGSGIYDPVCNHALKHDFYQLNNDLSIPIELLQSEIKSGKYKLILLVHYFGYGIENIEEIISLCKKNNIIVVEDCAHLYNFQISESTNIAVKGDFSFYSLHKNFPLQSGGLLVQNNQDLDFNILDIEELKINYSSIMMQFNVQEILKIRRQNFKYYKEGLSNLEGVSVLKEMREHDIPHTFPVYIEDGLREKLYFWLLEKDLTLIALYYRLIDPLKEPKFNNMQKLSSSILNLPLHQDVNKEDIEKVVFLISEGIKEVR